MGQSTACLVEDTSSSAGKSCEKHSCCLQENELSTSVQLLQITDEVSVVPASARETQKDVSQTLFGYVVPKRSESSKPLFKRTSIPTTSEGTSSASTYPDGIEGGIAENHAPNAPSVNVPRASSNTKQISQSEKHTRDPSVVLHVYDLRKFLNPMNYALKNLGLGLFHVGVAVFGEEWSFCLSGIQRHDPKRHPFHPYRESFVVGKTALSRKRVWKTLKEMQEYPQSWNGRNYHFIERNCASFAEAFCRELGVEECPAWISGAALAIRGVPWCRDPIDSIDEGLYENKKLCEEGRVRPFPSATHALTDALMPTAERDEQGVLDEGGQATNTWPRASYEKELENGIEGGQATNTCPMVSYEKELENGIEGGDGEPAKVTNTCQDLSNDQWPKLSKTVEEEIEEALDAFLTGDSGSLLVDELIAEEWHLEEPDQPALAGSPVGLDPGSGQNETLTETEQIFLPVSVETKQTTLLQVTRESTAH